MNSGLLLAVAIGVTAASPTGVDEGLGAHVRAITANADAQREFNRGLNYVYAFNHDEALRAFAACAKADANAAMCAWGTAYANGPHINYAAVPPDHAKAASEAVKRALDLAKTKSTPVERALIDALATRYAWPQPNDRSALDNAFADAMRDVYWRFPGDADVGAIFAEALMDLRPWDLWLADGTAQPGTPEIVATLEAVLAKAPNHPLALHLYIHAVEASPQPGKADAASERLRALTPGLGHLVHMPTHIDVRRGRWQQAIDSNASAMKADAAYATRQPDQGFYRLYMAHNHHMLTFGAMMTGQSTLAISTIRAMVDAMPPAWREESAAIADGYVGMPLEVLLRFGKWDDILKEPEPPKNLPIARGLRLYARGVACAAQGKPKEARAEQRAFLAHKKKLAKDAMFGNNNANDILSVAEAVLDGEILVAEGKMDEGIARLREGVKREDALRYDEPPDWIQPVRHPLGAALLKANKPAEAESVYREDLAKLPDNAWSLWGLARALRLQKKDADAAPIEAKLKAATAKADITLMSSCMCLPGV